MSEVPNSYISPNTSFHFQHPFHVNARMVYKNSSQEHEVWGPQSDVIENSGILGRCIVSTWKEGTIYPKNTKYKPQAITNCFDIVSSSLLIHHLIPEVDSSRYQQEVKFSNLFHFTFTATWTLQMKVALRCFIPYAEFFILFWFNMKFLSHLANTL